MNGSVNLSHTSTPITVAASDRHRGCLPGSLLVVRHLCQHRNELVFALYQHNRNPFVDRPDWVPAAFLPQLLVSRITNGVQLRWPGEFASAAVESARGFPAMWIPVTNAPTLSGDQWALDLLFRPQPRFYHLNLR